MNVTQSVNESHLKLLVTFVLAGFSFLVPVSRMLFWLVAVSEETRCDLNLNFEFITKIYFLSFVLARPAWFAGLRLQEWLGTGRTRKCF